MVGNSSGPGRFSPAPLVMSTSMPRSNCSAIQSSRRRHPRLRAQHRHLEAFLLQQHLQTRRGVARAGVDRIDQRLATFPSSFLQISISRSWASPPAR